MTLARHGSSARGKSTDGGGTVSLTLHAQHGGTYKFMLVGKKLDLSALNTGNADLTVALVAGDAQFVRNRTLLQHGQAYILPKKKKKG